jgi:hypothetical protein
MEASSVRKGVVLAVPELRFADNEQITLETDVVSRFISIYPYKTHSN